MPGYTARVPPGWGASEDDEGVWHFAPRGDTSAHVRISVIQAVGGPQVPKGGDDWIRTLLKGRQVPLRLLRGNVVAALPDTVVSELGTPVHMRYWYIAPSGRYDTLRVAVVSLATLFALPDTSATVAAARELAETLRPK